jgi:hypothetical protein
MVHALALPLGFPARAGRPSVRNENLNGFAALPSNAGAVDAALSFARGRRPFVAIRGATGWGKSRLGQIAADAAKERGVAATVSSADKWLADGAGEAEMLILDNVPAPGGKSKRSQRIAAELAKRKHGRKPTFCILRANRATRLGALNDGWFIETVRKPTAQEKAVITAAICSCQGIEVGAANAELMSRLIRGDGHSLQGAAARLSAVARPEEFATMHPVRLAGLLYPYFVNSSEWDLRDIVLEAVVQSSWNENAQYRNASKCTAVAVFTLRSVAGLCEESVAAYFGLSRGNVYRLCAEVKRGLESSDFSLRTQLERVLWLTGRQLSETQYGK